MFVGRQQELNTLHKLYNSGKFEFAVIYGRRRVGKTALISEFSKDKDTIFFTGVETNAKQNLDNFSTCTLSETLETIENVTIIKTIGINTSAIILPTKLLIASTIGSITVLVVIFPV